MAVVRIGKKQQLDLRPGRLGALPQPTPITQGATQLPLDLGPLPFQFENEFPSLRARLQRLSQFSARPLSALLVFLLGVATLDYLLF